MNLSACARIVLLSTMMTGCVGDLDVGETSQDVITSSLGSYTSGNSVVITYSGMQGTVSDFIALAHPNDPSNRYELIQLTGGGTAGSMTFDSTPLGAGTYVARAYYNWYGTSSYVIQQTSPSFTVTGGPSLTTSQASYTLGAPVLVSYTGFTGLTTDWVAINQVGSIDDNYSAYQYTTAGGSSGQLTFNGIAAGSYEARYHHKNSTATYAVSPQFSIGTSVIPDEPTYSLGHTVTVAFDGMPSTTTAFVAISVAGSVNASIVQYQRTNGVIKGTKVFTGLAAGTYEARAYSSSYVIQARSTHFVVAAAAASITTDHPSYQVGDAVTTTFSGLLGVAGEYVAVSLAGSSNAAIVQYQLTNNATSGTQVFTGLPAGTYEARAYFKSYVVAAHSAQFTIN